MKMKNGYAEFLRMFDWNYFITCRTHYKVHLMTARNWINKLIPLHIKSKPFSNQRVIKEITLTFLHVHMLIDTNTDMTYKEIRFGLSIF